MCNAEQRTRWRGRRCTTRLGKHKLLTLGRRAAGQMFSLNEPNEPLGCLESAFAKEAFKGCKEARTNERHDPAVDGHDKRVRLPVTTWQTDDKNRSSVLHR
jgi:hypothetical protein